MCTSQWGRVVVETWTHKIKGFITTTSSSRRRPTRSTRSAVPVSAAGANYARSALARNSLPRKPIDASPRRDLILLDDGDEVSFEFANHKTAKV
jgi:hypothetical protein